MDIAEYAYSLPNYCINDLDKMHKLDEEYRAYGDFLSTKGYLGEWNGLLFSMLQHYIIWGDYDSAVDIGRVYAKVQNNDKPVECDIALVLANHKYEPSNLSIEDVYKWNITDIRKNIVTDLDNVRNLSEFRGWALGSKKLDSLLILASRLHSTDMDKDTTKYVSEMFTDLFSDYETLDYLCLLSGQVGSWALDKWLMISVVLNSSDAFQLYGSQIKVVEARKYIASYLSESDVNLRWVNCALNNEGIFTIKEK